MALKDYPKFKKHPVYGEKHTRLKKMRRFIKTIRRAAYRDTLARMRTT